MQRINGLRAPNQQEGSRVNNQLNTAHVNVSATIIRIKCVSDKAPISAQVIVPASPANRPPLMALHGISRDSDAVVNAFKTASSKYSRIIIVPYFDKKNWPVFQRITGKYRPDLGLLAILGSLRQDNIIGNEAFDLFGFSGGAQLAHRFAMLFPEKVNELHLGAAGWYTFPDESLPYPLGIGPGGTTRKNWHQLMSSGLPGYLSRVLTVYVGDQDIHIDPSLRSDVFLNRVQGQNRLERAERYVECILQSQKAARVPITARLELLPNCGHDFTECCHIGKLVDRINQF